MSLPSGYKRLEYIQSSGAQYIDLGITAAGGIRVTTKFKFASWSSFKVLFGAYASSSNCNYFGVTTAHEWEFRTTEKANWGSPAADTVYELDFCSIPGNVYCKIDGTDQGLSVAGAASNLAQNVYLFALNRNGKVNYQASATLWDTKVYNSAGTLVRDLIPCKNASGVVGMWDDVNSVFYGNSGSGAFTAGPEITDQHKTLIGGVARNVKSGSCLIDGIGRTITNGRTLIGGIGHDVPLDHVPRMTLQGLSGDVQAYVDIGGTKYRTDGVYETEPGTTVRVCVHSEGDTSESITLNGTAVGTNHYSKAEEWTDYADYSFAPTKDATFVFTVIESAVTNTRCAITM